MVFSSPDWVSDITWEIPDSVPLGQFTLNGLDANFQRDSTKPLVVDGITGKSYSRDDIQQRVEWLAAGLARELGWSVNEGSPWDKVVAIYSLNTVSSDPAFPRKFSVFLLMPRQIDFFTLSWAIHRLNGICLLIHPTSSVAEIVSHMQSAKCSTLFTCQTLVSTSVGVAAELSIPLNRLFVLPLPEGFLKNAEPIDHLRGLEQLVSEGSRLPPLEPLVWTKGQAKEQVAYLCATSGTSGKQVRLTLCEG